MERNPSSPVVSAAQRRYLYFTAALAGAAILIVEILGTRMLAPYVGASHFVWTAQIMVTLAALATGYYAGGWLVDRSPKLEWFYGCVLLAAVYLGLTVLICEPVAFACVRFDPAVGALLISSILFFPPLTLLAVTGPFLARIMVTAQVSAGAAASGDRIAARLPLLQDDPARTHGPDQGSSLAADSPSSEQLRILTHSLGGVGGNVGRLYAVSTAGSLLGAGLISYLFIPRLPNSVSMDLTAGALIAVAAVWFLIWGKGNLVRRGGLMLAVALAGLGAGYAGMVAERQTRFAFGNELYRANSPFGLLNVIQSRDGRRRMYLNDYLLQNDYDPVEKKGVEMFTHALFGLARACTSSIENALCIGLGAGIVPMEFVRDGVRVDVVEINPSAPPLAARYFDCDLRQLNIFVGDGRCFIQRTDARYDAIILDVFLGESSPSHLMTREAFGAMQRIMKPAGVLAMNTFGRIEDGRDFQCASIEKTLRSVFRSVRVHAAGNGNVFFVASDQPDLQILRPPDLRRTHPASRRLVEMAFDRSGRTNPSHGIVLTDDYNPVDFYDAANRASIRRQLAQALMEQVKRIENSEVRSQN